MSDLRIKIVSARSGGAQFEPDTAQAQQGDSAFWGNNTNTTHQPWPTDQTFQPLSDAAVAANPALYMTDPVPAGASSSIYDCGTVGVTYYFCKLHPDVTSERGRIVASAPPSQLAINIEDVEPAFSPATQAAKPSDLIYWQNNSTAAHQPWPTDSQYQPLDVSSESPLYLCDEIAPGAFSQTYEAVEPEGDQQTWTVYYYCKLHPDKTSERGTIVITATS